MPAGSPLWYVGWGGRSRPSGILSSCFLLFAWSFWRQAWPSRGPCVTLSSGDGGVRAGSPSTSLTGSGAPARGHRGRPCTLGWVSLREAGLLGGGGARPVPWCCPACFVLCHPGEPCGGSTPASRPVPRLEDCGLTEAHCQDLSAALQANPSLTELSLRGNELGDGGVGLVLQALQSAACRLQKLRWVCTRGGAGWAWSQECGGWLGHRPHALRSSLQSCGLTEAGCGALPTALRALSSLRELQLGDNQLGDVGVRLLCEGILDSQCRLEKLECVPHLWHGQGGWAPKPGACTGEAGSALP
ncbi:Ribonuclease inhibitor [Galemys pyrenaicus]|uniref:Ribonuclease inhibitor n=1 Tax=Galemys pyrenaicus TaxID=202257 RepID=A0A8J6DPC5_GALPY|nr:Ribonuclease inhibitor [Galemys pyrenaicus]